MTTGNICIGCSQCHKTFTQAGTQARCHESWPQDKGTWGKWFYGLRSVTDKNSKANGNASNLLNVKVFIIREHLKVISLILTIMVKGSGSGTYSYPHLVAMENEVEKTK